MRLSEPLVLRNGQTLPNRLAKAAMTEGLADEKGRPTEALIRLFRTWGQGGAGLLITGNVQVDRQHLERAGNVVMDEPPGELMSNLLRRWAEAAKANGARVWMQLAHPGRQTPIGVNRHPKAPSAISTGLPKSRFGKPVALTEAEINTLIDRFVQAAVIAEATGFDGVQIHAAHGYLLSSFLSPRANQRNDQWGGALENRARMLLEIVRRVRQATGTTFSVSVKLNSADFQRGGFQIDDSVQVAQWLDAAEVDLLEISGGTYEAPRMAGVDAVAPANGAQAATVAREAYFQEFAPMMRRSLARAALMVTGGFRSTAGMQHGPGWLCPPVVGLARRTASSGGLAAVRSGLAITAKPLPDREGAQFSRGPGLVL
jgi:2,4-dienoyl-CoA reductase-like NADH-dependent reductase (Old Yellow Enzyme family)